MKNLIWMAIATLLLLNVSGCFLRMDCHPDPYMIGDFRKSNFALVPQKIFAPYTVNDVNDDKECPVPEKVKVPRSLLAINDLLSKGQKVSLYIQERQTEGGGISESRWESLYLDLYGSNKNFSIMDSSFFAKTTRSTSQGNLKSVSPDELGFMTQTDRNKIIEMTGVTHIYTIENQRKRSGAFKTDYFGGRLLEMATGKVIAVDEAQD